MGLPVEDYIAKKIEADSSIDDDHLLLYDASNCWQDRLLIIVRAHGQSISLSTDRRNRGKADTA